MPKPWASQPELCVSWCVWGVLEHGVWRVGPGKGQLLAVKRQPEGMGVRSSTTGKFAEEARDTIEARCHCWVVCKGQGRHCSPLPHAPAPASAGISRGACLSSLTHPSSQSLLHLCRSRRSKCQPHQAPWAVPVPVVMPNDTPAPACLCGHVCSGAALGADVGRRYKHRGSAKTTAEPQRSCN